MSYISLLKHLETYHHYYFSRWEYEEGEEQSRGLFRYRYHTEEHGQNPSQTFFLSPIPHDHGKRLCE